VVPALPSALDPAPVTDPAADEAPVVELPDIVPPPVPAPAFDEAGVAVVVGELTAP